MVQRRIGVRMVAAGAAVFVALATAAIGSSQASAALGNYTPITALDGSAGWTAAAGSGAVADISSLPDMVRPNGSVLLSTGVAGGSASFYRNGGGFDSTTTLTSANSLTYDTLTTSAVAGRLGAPVLGLGLDCSPAVSDDEMTAYFDPFDNTTAGHDFSGWTRWNAADSAANWTTTKFISTTGGGGLSNGPAGAGLSAGPDVLISYANLVSAFSAACPSGNVSFMEVRQNAGTEARSSRVDHLDFVFSAVAASATNSQDLDFRVPGTVTVVQSGNWGDVAQGTTAPEISFTVSSPADGPTVPNAHLTVNFPDLPVSSFTGCQSIIGGTSNPMALIGYRSAGTDAFSGPIAASLAPATSVVVIVRCTLASGALLGTYPVVPSVSADLGEPSYADVASGGSDLLAIVVSTMPTATVNSSTAGSPATSITPSTSAAAATTGTTRALPATGADRVEMTTVTGVLLLLSGMLLIMITVTFGRGGRHS